MSKVKNERRCVVTLQISVHAPHPNETDESIMKRARSELERRLISEKGEVWVDSFEIEMGT